MTHVVTDNCRNCRFTECVNICPVECFHLGEEMVYIDPDICIDCGGCIPVCPVQAIYDEVVIPEDKSEWVEKNKTLSATYPVMSRKLEPMDTAESRRAELGFGD
jgi:ferredoxin